MPKVVSVRVIGEYCLDVVFDDGTRGTASLEDRLFGPVFEPLQDKALFAQAFVDEFGVICWPNRAERFRMRCTASFAITRSLSACFRDGL